jgi:seryl-tRNA synthetase
LGERHGWLDGDAGAKLSGARFTVLRGQLARLHRALGQFMLDLHTGEHGYLECNVPVLVNAESMLKAPPSCRSSKKTCSAPWSARSKRYLIPTAEVSLTNLVRETIQDADALPLRFTAHSCASAPKPAATAATCAA